MSMAHHVSQTAEQVADYGGPARCSAAVSGHMTRIERQRSSEADPPTRRAHWRLFRRPARRGRSSIRRRDRLPMAMSMSFVGFAGNGGSPSGPRTMPVLASNRSTHGYGLASRSRHRCLVSHSGPSTMRLELIKSADSVGRRQHVQARRHDKRGSASDLAAAWIRRSSGAARNRDAAP